MKRGLFVIVVAAILLVAFASTAYAAIWNFEKSYSQQDRTVADRTYDYPGAYQNGTAGRGYDYADGVRSAGAGNRIGRIGAVDLASVNSSATFVYLQWWAVDPDNPRTFDFGNITVADGDLRAPLIKPADNGDGSLAVGSPHGGFLTSTVKCAVCHSVHTAAPAQDANAPVADTLLRMKAADACGYCHVAEGNTVMDPVFGGVWPIPYEAGHALGEPTCTECHTNVHGADAETEVASLVGKLLTLATDYGTGSPGGGSTVISRVTAIEASAAAQSFPAEVTGFSVDEYRNLVNTDIKNQAVGIFCGGCHEGSYATTVAGASASNKAGQQSGEFTGHRTMAQATDTWNALGAKVSSSEHESIKVADDAAQSCYSCHDADNGYNTGTPAFPHNWGTVPGTIISWDADAVVPAGENGEFVNQTFAWLLKASDSNRSDETTTGGVGGKSAHVGATGGTLSDGVCLKCHRWTGGGVGVTY